VAGRRWRLRLRPPVVGDGDGGDIAASTGTTDRVSFSFVIRGHGWVSVDHHVVLFGLLEAFGGFTSRRQSHV
jgi:hypothetical protein